MLLADRRYVASRQILGPRNGFGATEPAHGWAQSDQIPAVANQLERAFMDVAGSESSIFHQQLALLLKTLDAVGHA